MPHEPALPQFEGDDSKKVNARFHIGLQLYLVTFCYTSDSTPERMLRSHSAFYGLEPGADLQLKEVVFHQVEIKGHYLVNGEHDGVDAEPRFHGFVAYEESTAGYWRNQYPKATYGQKHSNTADFHFTNMNGGMPGMRQRAIELCQALGNVEEALREGYFNAAMKTVLEERLSSTIQAFHSAFPRKTLLRSGLIMNGQPLAGYHVTDRAAGSFPVCPSASARTEPPQQPTGGI
jgi:hypothetical protein